jgi:RimJ/RimL family protein N-acetyltransferase
MTLDDVEAVAAACSDPETRRWMPMPDPYTVEVAREFITTHDDLARRGERLEFGLRPAGSEALAGAIGVACDDRYPRGVAGMGYWTVPEFRRQGLTWRGLRLAASWVAASLAGLRRIEILVHPENVGSRRVAERAGATFEGIRRAGLPLPTGSFDAAVYSLLPEELPPVAQQ